MINYRKIKKSFKEIIGSGRYAVTLSGGISLHKTRRNAELTKNFFDYYGCGKNCNKIHKIFVVKSDD